MSFLRKNNRKYNEIRPIIVYPHFCPHAIGSVLYKCGNTQVICAVSQSAQVPAHAEEKGIGWLTAEYTMLPYSTKPRTERRMVRPDGRSVEIQRLIGRSLRTVVNLELMQNISLIVDCDVLQADGGTRTAAITGSYIALQLAIQKMIEQNLLSKNPIITNVAAISVGFIGNQLLLDLDYEEDSQCDVDLNLVMDGNGQMIEIQGTGEKRSYTYAELAQMIDVAKLGIEHLFKLQHDILNCADKSRI